ncbi:nitrate reductase [Paracraurococcus lichenis]|uniref:Molybdopterin-dependent oxidoreductase n=1 Tax=Paracraurococcus lichenis TaxID=3064888 RepID=A0ABT9DY72_9PROT|nr:nitrate reductase [Paracraurococcus sp. LOR1-02]MDO9708851.1 molybdopterin-dependent oxidoreductase [Paracraurococcus sp. LOR1-02]
MTQAVRTTCPYCGVGCGVLAQPDGRLVGDPAHPANKGRLCVKGAALGETLEDAGRLLHPMVDGARASWDAALDRIAGRFAETIAQHGPDAVAFYVSGQCLTEDYYVANKLMKGFIGSGNIDTNSRLCMASSVAGHTRAFGADVVPGVYEDLEEADLVVLVGSNLAWCHPVLHGRLQAARAARGTKLVVIDPRGTATSSGADLHLALSPGSDVALFAGLLAHCAGIGRLDRDWIAAHGSGFEAALAAARQVAPTLERVAALTGLDPEAIARFYAMFATTERTVTVYSQGVNQSAAGTDKVNAILNCHLATGRIGRPGMGPFSITGQPNAMGGREVGGLANQLAAHMRFDMPGAPDRVRRFWRAPNLAERPGLKAVDLFDAVLDGRVKALWVMATNPADSLPRAGRVREALAACDFLVVSDCWETDTTRYADVVLPAAGWGEKSGTVTNSERRISRQRPFRAAPGEAKPDWWALAEVGRRMGWAEAFAWESPAAVFREHAALSAFENGGTRAFDIGAMATLSDEGYDALAPFRWPLRAGATEEGDRLFAEGGFPTPDGRARFVATPFRGLAAAPGGGFPLLLNTGRLRDQWHTMTRTGQVPRLSDHAPTPAAAFAPADAAALGAVEGGLVRLATPHGEAVLRVALDPGQRPGEVFVPMHWTDAFTSSGPVDLLVGAATDPVSGQPELKATPLRAEALPVRWRGLLLHRDAVRPEAPGLHWSRVPVARGHVLELTGAAPLPAEIAPLVESLLAAPAGAELLHIADPARGAWRFAALVEGRVEACLFLVREGSRAGLPAGAALAALLDGTVTEAARPGLLAGRALAAKPAERNVCACFGVGVDTLRTCILDRRLTTVAEVGAALSAGTNCGSCVPEIRALLHDLQAEEAAA